MEHARPARGFVYPDFDVVPRPGCEFRSRTGRGAGASHGSRAGPGPDPFPASAARFPRLIGEGTPAGRTPAGAAQADAAKPEVSR